MKNNQINVQVVSEPTIRVELSNLDLIEGQKQYIELKYSILQSCMIENQELEIEYADYNNPSKGEIRTWLSPFPELGFVIVVSEGTFLDRNDDFRYEGYVRVV